MTIRKIKTRFRRLGYSYWDCRFLVSGVPLVKPKIGSIWSFFQNCQQLPEVPLVQPKIGIMWSFFQKYVQLPEIPLVQAEIGIILSVFQNHHQLPTLFKI